MKRILYAIAAAAILTSAPAFAQSTTTIDAIQSGASDLVDTLASALPFNSTVGLNWSDAYIGQLIGVPPHFGIGVTVGGTTVAVAGISDLLTQLGVPDLNVPAVFGDALPLPAAVAEARIGGFFLPFDIGVKAGYLPDSVAASLSDMSGGLDVNYLLAGADLRFAVLKGNILLPTVSVGVGFNYMKGGLGTTIGGTQSFTFNDQYSAPHTLSMTAPEIGLEWETTVIDLKAQVSKSLLIFTPYLGAGASYGMTKAGYRLTSAVSYDGTPLTDAQVDGIKQDMTDAGLTPPDFDSAGIRYILEKSGWAFRAFGGLSLNILVIKLDVTAMYNFSDGSLGGSAGIRFQL